MEPKVDIFVFAPQTYFTDNEIADAEERLEGFARVMHANQDVCVHKPEYYVSNSFEPMRNADIISDVFKKIVEVNPDEIVMAGPWECTEVALIRNFAKLADIKLVIFDIDNVIPGCYERIYGPTVPVAEV